MTPGSWEITSFRNSRILIATLMANESRVTSYWATAVKSMQTPPGSDFMKVAGLPFGPARNTALQTCLNQGHAGLLFLDSDTVPQPDMLMQLLATGKDYVGALYYRRYPPYEPVPCMRLITTNDKGQQIMSRGPLPAYKPGEIIPVDYLPTGATLISRRCLEAVVAKFPKPFEWTVDIDSGGAGLSEDFNFSQKAQSIGFQPYLHSVAPYSPIVIRHDGEIDIIPLEDLYQQTTSNPIYVDNMEVKKLDNTEIFGEVKNSLHGVGTDWTPLLRILRHHYEGELVHIVTNSGAVDVSPNHVLIPDTGFDLIDAEKVEIGQRLANPFITYQPTNRVNDIEHERHVGFFLGGEDLAWLYGMFAAEGSAPNKGISVSISQKDMIRLVKAAKILEHYFNHPVSITTGNDNCSDATLSSKAVHDFFRERFYTLDHNKRIPKEVLNAPVNIKRAFLQGYFEGDGSFVDNNKTEQGIKESFTTISQTLATGILWLMKQTENRDWLLYSYEPPKDRIHQHRQYSAHFNITNERPFEIPQGLCKCGCGQLLEPPIHRTFINGHNARRSSISLLEKVRAGYCACGCGNQTTVEQREYINGHNPIGVRLRDRRAVKDIRHFSFSGYLYDVETASGQFATGVGLIKVHNTGLICRHELMMAVGPNGPEYVSG